MRQSTQPMEGAARLRAAAMRQNRAPLTLCSYGCLPYHPVCSPKACIAMLTNKLPPKLKDPGSFTIPYLIGNHYVGKALCDLRVSINLMSMSIFRKLGIRKARPTTVTLQIADRSYAHAQDKFEDVLVRGEKFIFLADFIILECEADKEGPIILGQPFLETGKTLIDV